MEPEGSEARLKFRKLGAYLAFPYARHHLLHVWQELLGYEELLAYVGVFPIGHAVRVSDVPHLGYLDPAKLFESSYMDNQTLRWMVSLVHPTLSLHLRPQLLGKCFQTAEAGVVTNEVVEPIVCRNPGYTGGSNISNKGFPMGPSENLGTLGLAMYLDYLSSLALVPTQVSNVSVSCEHDTMRSHRH